MQSCFWEKIIVFYDIWCHIQIFYNDFSEKHSKQSVSYILIFVVKEITTGPYWLQQHRMFIFSFIVLVNHCNGIFCMYV